MVKQISKKEKKLKEKKLELVFLFCSHFTHHINEISHKFEVF